mgnify:CR=1 FL=1
MLYNPPSDGQDKMQQCRMLIGKMNTSTLCLCCGDGATLNAFGKYSRKEMLNAILYVLRTGCQWTDLPHDFPPWKSVYSQFLRWRDREVFIKLNEVLRKTLRLRLGRSEATSAGIVDSQSIKTTEKKGSVDSMEVKKLRVGKDIYWWITLDS